MQLAGMVVLPPFLIMLVVCVITATITEVASNTAVANIFLPILADTVILGACFIKFTGVT